MYTESASPLTPHSDPSLKEYLNKEQNAPEGHREFQVLTLTAVIHVSPSVFQLTFPSLLYPP